MTRAVFPLGSISHLFQAEPFFDAHKVIRMWQIENGGCPSLSCAYLQMHGKGPTTCSEVDVFLSAGIGMHVPLTRSFHT
jgi:hypothetical protein